MNVNVKTLKCMQKIYYYRKTDGNLADERNIYMHTKSLITKQVMKLDFRIINGRISIYIYKLC